jgi:hypothetical protein
MLRHIKAFINVSFKITEVEDDVYSSSSDEEEENDDEGQNSQSDE